MSEEKRTTAYPADSEVAQAAQELLREKEASEDNKLPVGRMKEFLVDKRLISNVRVSKLKGEELGVYKYVSKIVTKRDTVAKPCSTEQVRVTKRNRQRNKSDAKKLLKAPGTDIGGIC